MKTFNSWKDISIQWSDTKERFIVNLRPLGLKPSRPPFKTKTDAIAYAQDAFMRWSDPDAAPHEAFDDALTVDEMLELYLEEGKRRAKDPDVKFGWGSFSNYKDHISRLRKVSVDGKPFKNLKVSEIDKEAIQIIWDKLRSNVPSFRSADDAWQSLSRSFSLIVKREFIKSNPCDLLERSRPDETAKRIKKVIESVAKVSMETLRSIIEHTPDEHKLKIVFACRSGLRQSEQIALRVYDKKQPLEGGIDFDANKIYLRQAAKKGLTRGERYIGDPKTVAGIRNIPIDADLSESLKSFWGALPNRMKSERFLFPSEDGTMLDGTNLRERVLYRACKAAGMPRNEWPKWHELRHAFATHLLNGNKDWRRGMELMGHSDIRTTMIYTHVIEDPERDETEAAAMASSMPFNTNSKPNVAPNNVVKFKKVS